jgi:hypothetical protein
MTTFYGCGLALVGTVLGWVFGLNWIFQGMSMFKDGSYVACSKGEDWGIGKS